MAVSVPVRNRLRTTESAIFIFGAFLASIGANYSELIYYHLREKELFVFPFYVLSFYMCRVADTINETLINHNQSTPWNGK